MRMIKFRAKRVNGGEWVKSMTISYGREILTTERSGTTMLQRFRHKGWLR